MNKIVLFSALLMFLNVGCSSWKESKDSQQREEVSSNPKQSEEIVNSVLTANTEEMNLAKLGMKKANNQKVKDYAKRMFDAHADNNDKISAIAEKQEIMPPELTKSSRKLVKKTESKIEDLRNLEGKKFDAAFMDAQVKLHEKVLNKYDDTLIPNASNNELKAQLQQTRSKVEDHLTEAKDIRQTL